MTKKEISEQLQCNLIAYLDGMPQQVVDGVCDVVVKTLNAMTTINKIKIAEAFIEVMQEYQQRQEDDPNFDVSTRFYDLYDELTFIYNDNA